MTTRLTLNELEIGAILPGLELMLNRIADLRLQPLRLHPESPLFGGRNIYNGRSFDETLYRQLLSSRNKIRWIGSSNKVRLNSFEIAAAALALRVVRKQRLAASNILQSQAVVQLDRKLEVHRKRAKRAFAARHGAKAYADTARRWRAFVAWLRFHALANPSSRSAIPRSVLRLRQDQRKTMRSVTSDLMIDAADRKKVFHLADLARREVLRDRHSTSIGALLSDIKKTRQFMIEFIAHRNPELLRPEYQPECVLAAKRGDRFRAALQAQTATTAGVPNDTQSRSAPTETPQPHRSRHLRQPVAPSDLTRQLASWLTDEVEPNYWADVLKEIQHQVWTFPDRHRTSIQSTKLAELIKACCPPVIGKDGPELLAFWAEWGTRIILALNPNVNASVFAIQPALEMARENWQQMKPLTKKRKQNQIYRSYFI